VSMQVMHLADYGVPRMVVESWREKMGEELLPIQRRAVVDYQVLNGASLMISAPTSSGKTFCGELAAVTAVFKRKKALFIVPLKSIAEERFAEFRTRYSGLGIRVAVSTADRKDFDAELEQGRFDLGILVYEKFNQLLVKNIDLLASVDLLLVDEVQMLSEPERGWCLELALLKVLNSGYSPQIIALSGVLKDAHQVAAWLGCALLEDDFRPVELRQGVLWRGEFRYRNFNGRQEGKEQLGDATGDDPVELLLTNIERLIRAGEQVQVFLKSKRNCEQLAETLAERNFWSPAQAMISRLSADGGSVLGEKLEQTLGSAVAFHHADLSSTQRRFLEDGFRVGEIRVMVSTTTLAMGVNLPAQTVFIDCYKYQIGSRSGRPMIVPLNWQEYEAMSGRAGRYGGNGAMPSDRSTEEQSFGRSVLIAGSRAEAETMWQTYVEGKPGALVSRLAGKSMYDLALDLIASRCVRQVGDVAALLQKSFHCRQGGSINADVLNAVIVRLAELKLVFVKDDRLESSPIGALISRRGVSVSSGMMMVSFCQAFPVSDRLSWLYFALTLPDATLIPVYLTRQEAAAACYRRRLCDYVTARRSVSPELAKMVADDYVLSEEQNVRLKAAFLLLDWIGDETTKEIELKYHINVGSIQQVGEAVAWLLDTAAGTAALLNRQSDFVVELRQLTDGVALGFDLSDTDLGRTGLSSEQRDVVWKLFGAGIISAEQFCEANRDKIIAAAGDELAETLINRFKSMNEKNGQSIQEVNMSQLRLRGLLRGDRVYFNFKNKEIDITAKSYNYLFKLTAARLLNPDGWLAKDEIEPGFNQAKNIYRVKQELKRFATGLEQRIENNGAGYYRINLSPEQIKIDFDSMKSFCDLELAELARRLEGQAVC
jgi:helicase